MNKKEPQKVLLFIHMVTVAEKIIDSVVNRFPDCKITLLLRFDARREHIEKHPAVDSCILYRNVALNPFDLLKGRLGFAKEVRKDNFDLIIVPDKKLKSYILSIFARGDLKLYYDVDSDKWGELNLFEFFIIFFKKLLSVLIGPFFFAFILLIT